MVIGAASSGTDAGEAVAAEFTDEQRAELTLTIATAQGFSKAAIAWGPAPDLPTMVIPTPGATP